MMLKTIQQWDICSQEDLETFRKESEAIHQSVARTLYQTDPYADPSEEPDESTSEAELVSAAYPGREEFLKRLSRHLAQQVNPGADGYTITVKATVDCRHGKAVRAEFVEAEGPRLADLPNPNGGRVLEALTLHEEVERPYPDRRPVRKHQGRREPRRMPGTNPGRQNHRADGPEYPG